MLIYIYIYVYTAGFQNVNNMTLTMLCFEEKNHMGSICKY